MKIHWLSQVICFGLCILSVTTVQAESLVVPPPENHWALMPVLSLQQLNGVENGYETDFILSNLSSNKTQWSIELGYLSRYSETAGFVIASDVWSMDAQHALVFGVGVATAQSISWLQQLSLDYYLPSLWHSESMMTYGLKTYSDLLSQSISYMAELPISNQVTLAAKLGASFSAGSLMNTIDPMLSLSARYQLGTEAYLKPYYAHGSESDEVLGATPGVESFSSNYFGVTVFWSPENFCPFWLTAEYENRSNGSWASELIFQNRLYW